MSLKHLKIFDEDDDDPMLSAINLVDVFLVLIVALLAAVSFNAPSASQASKQDSAKQPVEIVMQENGQEIRYKGTGSQSEGQGVRAGVAYRLKDGSIIYVPESAGAKP